jgi:hypothetical protein
MVKFARLYSRLYERLSLRLTEPVVDILTILISTQKVFTGYSCKTVVSAYKATWCHKAEEYDLDTHCH